MVIIVDKEGKKMIRALLDVVLRAGGLQNLQPVVDILNSMKSYVEPPPPEKQDEGEGA